MNPHYYAYFKYGLILIFLLTIGCKKPERIETFHETLFTLVDKEQSNIHFANRVEEDLYFNFINYPYIYNGGGVAVGDINNDGLEDVYFTSNQQSNALYLNQDDFKFQDITASAGVKDDKGWSTGVTMVDINHDGWLDIYVCKSGALKNHPLRKNKLFINQKNNTFKEEAAKYGLDHFGFSVQAYFFDFDGDSDLDMYLVNHRADFQNNAIINLQIQAQKEDYHSDQLFRNDGKKFTNVTKEAGTENKAWGLSASIGDFNQDNLPDVFVANDFLEPDFLYINQGDGTFKDEILSRFKHISANSMGSDFADINNDLKPDLIVLDMLAEDHIRSKENMATMSTSNFNLLVNSGYHHQYMSNMLQLNNGDGSYSEIGQLTGIAKTDWSWAPLIADFNNDGFKDVFVTNGIERDLSNQDFRNQMKANIRNHKKVSLNEAINMMPSAKLSNYMFNNTKDLGFTNSTKAWGLDKKVNSCGVAYADLDNDGDLDLILNNQNEVASIYQNNTEHNYISFSLKGPSKNPNAIGCQISVYASNLSQTSTVYTSRGFQSSVSKNLLFGLGELQNVDSIEVQWQDSKKQVLTNLGVNQNVVIDYKQSESKQSETKISQTFFESINPSEIGINYIQKENEFDDFGLQLLLPQKQSEKGAPIAIGDVNNDGLEDLFIGNAKDEKGSLFIQNKDGIFAVYNHALFNSEKHYEDTDAQFVDYDNDGDLDLYVASGGYEIPENDALLQDRLYKNDGTGNFSKAKLPQHFLNSRKVIFADWDQDGDQDAFIAGGVIHGKYPLANKSLLLENNAGQFKDVSNLKGLLQESLKIVNDAIFTDFDNDNDLDLIVVGEWMTIVCYENSNNHFKVKDFPNIKDFKGWCQNITKIDIDNDGFQDYLIGNWGENNKFHPSVNKPLHIYADYLDDNKSFDIVLSKVSKKGTLLPVRGKECSSQQTPFINEKLSTYQAFANSTLPEIYGARNLEKATHYEATNFSMVVLKNIKGKAFEIQNLPKEAQFSPTLGFEVIDLNQDGFQDVLGVGNIYDAEVETIRYDASKGYILINSSSSSFNYHHDLGFLNNYEAKAIKKITINKKVHFIILNKNSAIKLLKIKD